MADEDITLDGQPLQSLRVADLKAALERRNLPKNGQKNTLIKRLKGVSFCECYGRLCRVWPSLVGGDRQGAGAGGGVTVCGLGSGNTQVARHTILRIINSLCPQFFSMYDNTTNPPTDRANIENVTT